MAATGPALAQGRGMTPSDLKKPLRESWSTGRRYSVLNLVNTTTVRNIHDVTAYLVTLK